MWQDGQMDGRTEWCGIECELLSLLVLQLQFVHFEFGAADTCCVLGAVYLRRR